MQSLGFVPRFVCVWGAVHGAAWTRARAAWPWEGCAFWVGLFSIHWMINCSADQSSAWMVDGGFIVILVDQFRLCSGTSSCTTRKTLCFALRCAIGRRYTWCAVSTRTVQKWKCCSKLHTDQHGEVRRTWAMFGILIFLQTRNYKWWWKN